MRKILFGLLGLGAIASFPALGGEPSKTVGLPKVEIKRYRFQAHKSQNFERLVLEFTNREKLNRQPTVHLNPNSGTKSTNIRVDNASLVGNIPESEINDSFQSRARYFGLVALSADTNGGFSLKTNLKDSNVNLDAFWLENPSRLVIDAFPANSPRAAGPAILEQASHEPAVKSHRTVVVKEESDEDDSRRKKKRRKKPNELVCFPSEMQVAGEVKIVETKGKKNMKIEVPEKERVAVEMPKNVLCFPNTAKLDAMVDVTKPIETSKLESVKSEPVKVETAKTEASVDSKAVAAKPLAPVAPVATQPIAPVVAQPIAVGPKGPGTVASAPTAPVAVVAPVTTVAAPAKVSPAPVAAVPAAVSTPTVAAAPAVVAAVPAKVSPAPVATAPAALAPVAAKVVAPAAAVAPAPAPAVAAAPVNASAVRVPSSAAPTPAVVAAPAAPAPVKK